VKFIPYGTQWIDEDDIDAVVKVLRSNWLTQGPAIAEFESALADYCGAGYAVAVSSGTAALHLATLAAGVSPGDKVAVTPMTFVASANCVLYAGGLPRFVDIDPDTHNLTPEALSTLFEAEEIKAVIPVHFAGQPCDMVAIGEMARARGIPVIEDACHALGAQYQDAAGDWVKVGSCRDSEMTVFSFHPVKHITTGEGGAVTTNDPDLCERLRRLRSHGITKDPVGGAWPNDDQLWFYEMRHLGFNYRITDIQSSLGRSQLARLDAWLARRAAIADTYDRAFADQDRVKTRASTDGFKSANHLYVIEVDHRNEVYVALRERGVGTQVHYIPVHFQPYYRERFGHGPGDFPVAEAYYRRCLSIPLFPKMSDGDVELVAAAVIEEAGKERRPA